MKLGHWPTFQKLYMYFLNYPRIPNFSPFAWRLAISTILAILHFPIGQNVKFQYFFLKKINNFDISKFEEASFVWDHLKKVWSTKNKNCRRGRVLKFSLTPYDPIWPGTLAMRSNISYILSTSIPLPRVPNFRQCGSTISHIRVTGHFEAQQMTPNLNTKR